MDAIVDRLKVLMAREEIEKASDLSFFLLVPEQTVRVWLRGGVPKKNNPIWQKLDGLGV